jgi:hypothetical protein
MATPMTRYQMRSLKYNKDEEARLLMIDKYVKMMYDYAVGCARNSTKTQWRTDFHNGQGGQALDGKFILTNITDIIRELQKLFPDCLVEFRNATMAKGPDGEMHDISTLDEKALMFIGNRQVTQSIIIDWS